MRERNKSGILGFIVADAMGVPVEFSRREERKLDPVTNMREYGTYHQPRGTWSDDTSLTLCLLENLIEGYSLEKLAKKFVKYYREGYLTPYNEIFDIGNATRVAIEMLEKGIEPIKCGGNTEYDNGNGSLMRVFPLAYYLRAKNPLEKIKVIEDVSSLTHRHKKSKLACIFYVEIAINLLNGESRDKAYSKTIEFINKYCIEEYNSEMESYSRVLDGNIAKLKENEISSSGYVIHTLEAVVWSFMTSKSYSEAILKAVNLGEDTDTIGAITGGLAGCYYGIESIPSEWAECLAKKEEIDTMIGKFNNI